MGILCRCAWQDLDPTEHGLRNGFTTPVVGAPLGRAKRACHACGCRFTLCVDCPLALVFASQRHAGGKSAFLQFAQPPLVGIPGIGEGHLRAKLGIAVDLIDHRQQAVIVGRRVGQLCRHDQLAAFIHRGYLKEA